MYLPAFILLNSQIWTISEKWYKIEFLQKWLYSLFPMNKGQNQLLISLCIYKYLWFGATTIASDNLWNAIAIWSKHYAQILWVQSTHSSQTWGMYLAGKLSISNLARVWYEGVRKELGFCDQGYQSCRVKGWTGHLFQKKREWWGGNEAFDHLRWEGTRG